MKIQNHNRAKKMFEEWVKTSAELDTVNCMLDIINKRGDEALVMVMVDDVRLYVQGQELKSFIESKAAELASQCDSYQKMYESLP